MDALRNLFTKQPLLSTILAALIYVLPLVIIGDALGWNDNAAFAISYKAFTVISISAILIGLGWAERAWITTPFRKWNRKWPLFMIPMILIVILNLGGLDTNELEFSGSKVLEWIVDSLFTGLFEEFLTRALMLYILYRAWGHTRAGIYKAVVAAGVIFGAAHFANLLVKDVTFGEVFTQVVAASIIGIFFGAAILLIRTIWPGVMIHALVDMAGAPELYLHKSRAAWGDYYDAAEDPETAGQLIGLVLAVAVLVGIPALLMLRKAPTNDEMSAILRVPRSHRCC